MQNDMISKSALIKSIEENKNIVRDSMNSRVHEAYKMAHEDIIRIVEGKEVVRKPSDLEILENRMKNLKECIEIMNAKGEDTINVEISFMKDVMAYTEKLRNYMTLEHQKFLVNTKYRLGDIVYGLLFCPGNAKYTFTRAEVKEISIGTYDNGLTLRYKTESIEKRGTIYEYYPEDLYKTAAEAEKAVMKKNGGTK